MKTKTENYLKSVIALQVARQIIIKMVDESKPAERIELLKEIGIDELRKLNLCFYIPELEKAEQTKKR